MEGEKKRDIMMIEASYKKKCYSQTSHLHRPKLKSLQQLREKKDLDETVVLLLLHFSFEISSSIIRLLPILSIISTTSISSICNSFISYTNTTILRYKNSTPTTSKHNIPPRFKYWTSTWNGHAIGLGSVRCTSCPS